MTNEVFIHHTQIKQALRRIEMCHRSPSISREPQGLLLSGLAGVGKSLTAECYRDRYPTERNVEGQIMPVLLSSIPADATVKGVQTSLLRSLNDRKPEQGTKESQASRLIKLFQECQVTLLMLDEFQHLISRKNARVLQDIADWLKNLINTTRLPVVLMGMPESREVLDHDKQLRRRFSSIQELYPFSMRDKDAVLEYRRFMRGIEKRLLSHPIGLSERDMLIRMHAATEGFPSEISKLINAARLAAEGNGPLRTGDFVEAFELVIGYSHERPRNPFDTSIAAIRKWPGVRRELGDVA